MSGASNGAKDMEPFNPSSTKPGNSVNDNGGVPPGHKVDPKTGKIIQKGVGKEYQP